MAEAQQPGRGLPSVRRLTRVAAPIWLAVITAGSFASSPRASFIRDHFVPDTSVGFRYPSGIALDRSGAVYVASRGDSAVAVFARDATGSVAPVRRIGGARTGLVSPQAIALDSRGRILVASGRHRVENGGSITVYPPNENGNAEPVRVILGAHTGLRDPRAIAAGPRGEVYVLNAGGKAVIGFGAHADGDAEPEQHLTLGRGAGPFTDSDEPGATDVEIGNDGSLLVLDAEGVTTHRSTGPQRRQLVRRSDAKRRTFGFAHRPRFARAPGGELYVLQKAPLGAGASRSDSMFLMFDGFAPKAVFVYLPGDTTPARTVGPRAGDTRSITDLAVGRDGALYMLTGGSPDRRPREESRITIYPPDAAGDVPPARVIAGPRTGLVNPSGIAVDREGRIYVTNSEVTDNTFEAARLTVYAPDADGDAAPIRTISGPATRMSAPAGVAVADDGTVYVVNGRVYSGDYGSVRVYAGAADGDAPPQRTLIGPETRLINPTGLAVGRGDTVYVASSGLRRVTVHPPRAGLGQPPVRILEGDSTELGNSSGLAIDQLGQLYVADRQEASGINAFGPDLGAVRVYRAGVSGNKAPLRTIRGGLTRLNGPGGLAVDRRGNVYVPNRWGRGAGSVTVYSPAADGDVRPLRMIAGPATGLRSPVALTLDAHDTLYVVNAGTVTVYQPGADGNAAPIRTFWGP